jgi:hypothetical protein
MKELYGKGYQPNEYIEKYYWLGKIVTASYDENSITNDADLYFESKEISKQIEMDKKNANKKATTDM